MIPPTPLRSKVDSGHRPPLGWRDHTGQMWLGTSRVLDKPARKRAMRRTWKAMKAQARREYVESTRGD